MNLGIALFCHGSVLFELFKLNWFAGIDKGSMLRHAFISFKEFCKKHKIQCSQPPFKSYMYVTTGEEYCYLGTKASWHHVYRTISTLSVDYLDEVGLRMMLLPSS